MLYLDEIPNEILVKIFLSCSSISNALNLAACCHRLKAVYNSCRLPILTLVVDAQYGPLHDAIQLLTYNHSQRAYTRRDPSISLALLKELIHIGRIAACWEEIYPYKKWKRNFEDRRLITDAERFVVRRALYRLWLYSRAFHNRQYDRCTRLNLPVVLDRAKLLHNWTTPELSEMADVQNVIREVLGGSVCPSNGTIQRKVRKRFSEHYELVFNMQSLYPFPNPSSFGTQNRPPSLGLPGFSRGINKFSSKYKPTPTHEPGDEGWGDDLGHYYVVEDMLKLDPEQILWLRGNAPTKGQVEQYVDGLGEWFDNNGETFGQTLGYVLLQRGEDAYEFLDAIAKGNLGVALKDG